MKQIILIFFLLSSIAFAEENSNLIQAKAFIQRLVPEKAHSIDVEILPSDKINSDRFELESVDGKIIIRGNNANSIAVGLNHYLKYFCHTSVSWYVDNPIELPEALPAVPNKITKSARCENRFFLNYCTFGYTMPWWQWRDWERLIDWMALNGVTMPLAITGQEAVWYRVWTKLGLSDTQIREYFTGPAHLPWHRMANIDYWQGALPHSWLDHQLELQKKIVTRERELNMTPVLPAFSGHVPAAIHDQYPEAKINKLGYWGGFKDRYRSHFLDPLDPLFQTIQKEFLTEQTKLFGTDHIYGTDPFNEVKPPSWEPDYLARVGKTIYESMHAVDPDARWLQMTWVFYFDRKHWTNERIKSMVRSVPQDRMILLDYYCENKEVWKMTDQFFGQPYIWCYLGNFGGNTMMTGNLATVEERIENTFKNGGDKVWGIGSTLEALDVNPVMYEYVFEKAWTTSATNTKSWINRYADSRCGAPDPSFREAWDVLREHIYIEAARLGQGTLTNARPTLSKHGNWTTNSRIGYDNKKLLQVWKLMLQTQKTDRDAYRYDLLNVSRQCLGNHFTTLRDQFSNAYETQNLAQAKQSAAAMIALLEDLDTLLATRRDWMFGTWQKEARAMAKDKEEEAYYERNARTVLSTWGERGQSLNDYANRTWSGMLKGYYSKRWQMFTTDVLISMTHQQKFDPKVFKEKILTFEWDWANNQESYSSTPKGDTLKISQQLFSKYQKEINN